MVRRPLCLTKGKDHSEITNIDNSGTLKWLATHCVYSEIANVLVSSDYNYIKLYEYKII